MSPKRRFLVPAAAVLLLSLGSPSALFAAEGGELPRIVNFAILAAVLVLVLRKPLADFLNAKTTQIREELSEARTRETNAEVERKRAEELLASLNLEVQKAKDEAIRSAQAEKERILKTAEHEAARIFAHRRRDQAEVEAGRRRLFARATELQSTSREEEDREHHDRRRPGPAHRPKRRHPGRRR
jgi:F0F1-type ATP synthase membrane subunit b/b'